MMTACKIESLPTSEMNISGHTIEVEIADTENARANGLMNRKSMAENHGMLFVFDKDRLASFWMKNTLIPLSIAFISSDGTIRQIEDMEPESLASVGSFRSVLYALEMNQGWFDERNIKPGDIVELPEL